MMITKVRNVEHIRTRVPSSTEQEFDSIDDIDVEYSGDHLTLEVEVYAPTKSRGEVLDEIVDAIQGVEFDDPSGPDDPPSVEGRRKVG